MTVDLSTSLICSAFLLIVLVSKLSQGLDQTLKTSDSLGFRGGGRRQLSTYELAPSWFNLIDTTTLIPNVTVAKDGTGDFTTINQALSPMPQEYTGRYIIYVKTGTYDEQVLVIKDGVLIYGNGPSNTIITGKKSSVDGIATFQTATFALTGNMFIAKSIEFQNTTGAAKHQAVALRVQSDMSVFFNCRMDGFQDKLYASKGKQFYQDCVISGTIDFIFGDAMAVFQNCHILLHKLIPSDLLPVRFQVRTYLGKPWGSTQE